MNCGIDESNDYYNKCQNDSNNRAQGDRQSDGRQRAPRPTATPASSTRRLMFWIFFEYFRLVLIHLVVIHFVVIHFGYSYAAFNHGAKMLVSCYWVICQRY